MIIKNCQTDGDSNILNVAVYLVPLRPGEKSNRISMCGVRLIAAVPNTPNTAKGTYQSLTQDCYVFQSKGSSTKVDQPREEIKVFKYTYEGMREINDPGFKSKLLKMLDTLPPVSGYLKGSRNSHNIEFLPGYFELKWPTFNPPTPEGK